MSKHFTHLHLHTDFSLLDGAITIEKLIDFGKKQKFKSLAISDHGNIFGAVKFFKQCKKAGMKPILGMESYFTEDVNIKNADDKYNHLLLIVQNEVGYKNLCKLISFAYQKGFYFKPRIDRAILEKHSQGLIATSSCLGGQIPQLLIKDKQEEAEKKLQWFLQIFGPERFYLEVQPTDQDEQKVLNNKLYELSKTKNIPLVATGDCHYVSLDDHQAHEVMLSIQTHGQLSNPNRYSFGNCRTYMRTTEQMLEEFKDHPEAVWNSGKIADSCDFDFTTGKLFFPKFEIPQEYTAETFFKHLCYQGFEKLKNTERIPLNQEKKYKKRLDLEIDLISNMGFVGYFLIVSDFIRWARKSGIPVGPGRGSAAGSLVAWSLEITNIDPLKYNLLFERFLNPERMSMPDIDIDFCIEGRDTVINYVRDKYGHDKVCQIITFGTMMAKGVIKDVARVLGFSFEDSNTITRLIPDQLKITLHEAIEQEPRLKELIESNPKAQQLFNIAFRLEGITRHASKHAAGIVITPEAVDDMLPVYVPPKSTELVTQYAMTELEDLGFLKIDFLGLKNLTLIDRAVKLIKKNHTIDIDVDKLPLDDEKTFALLCDGKTSGVFQLESSGIKEVLRKLHPEKFEDIIAVNALYRPGPLGSGMVDDFIERKHGRQKITLLFDELKPILQETYGVIVYQEQVMKVASTIAGYSLGEADILRRAMGKKKVEVMAEQRTLFLQKSKDKGFDEKKSGQLFDLMAYFAGYGFNKSHSAAYAMIAYQTAYLKANYPAEFMSCLISLETGNADKMSFYLQEAKDMGIKILPPDINTSKVDFSVVDGNILFGLHGIKNVGKAALENILAEREKKGPFADLFNFCKRIDLRLSNKRVKENLIAAGAFDLLPGNRAQKTEELQRVIGFAIERKQAELTGQMDLFGLNRKKNKEDDLYAYQPRKEWSEKEKLEKEKEVVGFYLSSHPLESHRKQLAQFGCMPFDVALERSHNMNSQQEFVTISCGLLKNRKDILTKKGDRMSFVQLEDTQSEAEIILFPRLFKKVEVWLDEYNVFLVRGSVDFASTQKCKILANVFIPLELVFQEWPSIQSATCVMPSTLEENVIQEIKELLSSGRTPLSFRFTENGKNLELKTKKKISLDNEFNQFLDEHDIKLECKL